MSNTMTRNAPICRSPDGMSGGAPVPPGGNEPDRFAGIRRDYTLADVQRLSGSFTVKHTLAEMGARRLWHLLKTEPYVNTL
jgi:isocitrate lyase